MNDPYHVLFVFVAPVLLERGVNTESGASISVTLGRIILIFTKRFLFILSVCVLSTGCSTISGSGTSQSLSVQTLASDGTDLDGAKCDLVNDEGTWFVMTPGSVVVRKSNKDLQVICKKTGVDVGTASVVSRTKGSMFGNIILGGGIGAIIDHNNGSAYEYPGLIKILMGRINQKIEEKSTDSTSQKNDEKLAEKTAQSEKTN